MEPIFFWKNLCYDVGTGKNGERRGIGERMDLHLKNRLETGATVISNMFIDKYMAEANGEYVKVYLYLLRRGFSGVSEGEIADALNDTEADVRRALAYWRRLGVLEPETAAEEVETERLAGVCGQGKNGLDGQGEAGTGSQGEGSQREAGTGSQREAGMGRQGETGTGGQGYAVSAAQRGRGNPSAGETAAAAVDLLADSIGAGGAAWSGGSEGPAPDGGALSTDGVTSKGAAARLAQQEYAARSACTEKEMNELSSDAEFTQLLYIAQQYLKKIFTPKDCEVFAYLYGKLRMSAELLEYLVEYCAQNNHTSLRYIEKVAISWHEKKLLTVEEAKAYSRSFSKDSFAVMKAFGLTGRSPADSEYALLEKWYRTYGFTKELVLAACDRTMNAIHAPSFQYADRILSDWKEAGVRTMRDVEELDRIRREQKGRDKQTKDQQRDTQKTRSGKGGKTPNRFHNLEEHGYDYDKMVWNMINSEQETQ